MSVTPTPVATPTTPAKKTNVSNGDVLNAVKAIAGEISVLEFETEAIDGLAKSNEERQAKLLGVIEGLTAVVKPLVGGFYTVQDDIKVVRQTVDKLPLLATSKQVSAAANMIRDEISEVKKLVEGIPGAEAAPVLTDAETQMALFEAWAAQAPQVDLQAASKRVKKQIAANRTWPQAIGHVGLVALPLVAVGATCLVTGNLMAKRGFAKAASAAEANAMAGELHSIAM